MISSTNFFLTSVVTRFISVSVSISVFIFHFCIPIGIMSSAAGLIIRAITAEVNNKEREGEKWWNSTVSKN